MRRPLTDKQHVRVAGRIHDQLQSGTVTRLVNLEAQLQQVATGAEHLRTDRRKLHVCKQRGWMGPVPRLLSRIERSARELSYALSGLERAGQSVRRQGPSLREVHAELSQAQDEFGILHYDRRTGELSVVTEPVELDGVYLGPFEIHLEIQSLTDPRHVPYRVVALEPHPAACNAAVTHPHISDDRLCPADDDPLYIEDFVTVRQEVTSASISFDDEAVADFFDRQVDLGRRPEQFARLWVHTHPGGSPTPSHVDEETFQRVFGRCDWAVMFVLARGGKTYARLRFNVGPGGQVMVPVEVDYAGAFDGADHEAWEAEYKATIRRGRWSWDLDTPLPSRHADEIFGAEPQEADVADWEADDWMAAFEELPPEDRRAVLEELASRPDLWHEAEEVMPW